MAYKKQNFQDGDILTADQLNHIEDGIAGNEERTAKVVLYEYQLLSEVQKRQVRTNIDALGQSDLESATDTALAKAKASGEFNGADGKDGKDGTNGKDGEKGEKGDKGDPYTLTDADKATITQAVIDALPKYNGEVIEI